MKTFSIAVAVLLSSCAAISKIDYTDSARYAVYENYLGHEVIFDKELGVFYTSGGGPREDVDLVPTGRAMPMEGCSTSEFYCLRVNGWPEYVVPIHSCASQWNFQNASFRRVTGGCNQEGPWVIRVDPENRNAEFHYIPNVGITKIIFSIPSMATPDQRRWYEYNLISKRALLSSP